MKIYNRTPHDITIIPSGVASDTATITIPAAPRGEVARVETVSRSTSNMDVFLNDGTRIPVSATGWGRIVGLPAFVSLTYHVVSVVVAAAAFTEGRDIDDLLIPGMQVRDASGRIIGCQSLTTARSALPGDLLMGLAPHKASARHQKIADLLSMREWRPAHESDVQPHNTRRPVGFMNFAVAYLCRCEEAPYGYGGWYIVGWQYGYDGYTSIAVDRAQLDAWVQFNV